MQLYVQPPAAGLQRLQGEGQQLHDLLRRRNL
jgi:hypothetical protein